MEKDTIRTVGQSRGRKYICVACRRLQKAQKMTLASAIRKIYTEQPGEHIFKVETPYERYPSIKFCSIFGMPLLRLLQKINIKFSPIYLTLTGLLCNIMAGLSFATGHLTQGALLFLTALIFDLVDGTWARLIGRHVSFMKKFDPICDRIGKAACFIGLVCSQSRTSCFFIACYYLLEAFATIKLPDRFNNPRNWFSFSAWEASLLIFFVAPILNMVHILLPVSIGLLGFLYATKMIKR